MFLIIYSIHLFCNVELVNSYILYIISAQLFSSRKLDKRASNDVTESRYFYLFAKTNILFFSSKVTIIIRQT